MTDNLFETCTTMEECLALMGKIHTMFTKQMKKMNKKEKNSKNTKRNKKYTPTRNKCGVMTKSKKPCERKAYVELQGRCPCHSGVADRELDFREHPCHVDFMSKFPDIRIEDSEDCPLRLRLIVTERYTTDYVKWVETMPREDIRWVKMVPNSDDSFDWDPKSFSLVKVTEGCDVQDLTKKGHVFRVKFTKYRTEEDEDECESMVPLDGEI